MICALWEGKPEVVAKESGMPEGKPEFDVFLSYNNEDRGGAERVAQALKVRGLTGRLEISPSSNLGGIFSTLLLGLILGIPCPLRISAGFILSCF